MPKARPRSRGSVNVDVRMDSTDGASRAPKRPCRPRAPISIRVVCAAPPTAEATANPMTPAMRVRLGPNMSLMRPPRRRNPPKASVYAVTTHCRSEFEKPRECWADGRAMIMMVESSTTISCAPAITTRIHQWAAGRTPVRCGLRRRRHRDAPARRPPGGGIPSGQDPVDLPLPDRRVRQGLGRRPHAGHQEVEVPSPRPGHVGARRLQHAAQRPQHEGHVGARQVVAHPAVRLGIGHEPGDQRAGRGDERMVGAPQLGEAAEVRRLVGARRLEEVLEGRPVLTAGRLAGHGDRLLQDLGDEGVDERLLRREPSVERAHPHAGRPGHVGHARLESFLLEHLPGRLEQARAVPLRVAPDRPAAVDGPRGPADHVATGNRSIHSV